MVVGARNRTAGNNGNRLEIVASSGSDLHHSDATPKRWGSAVLRSQRFAEYAHGVRKLVLVLLVALVAGCGSSARTLGATENEGGPLPGPGTPLAAVDAPWVEFEARWLCDLQRSTYDDPSDVDAALADRLAEEAIVAEEYAAFKQRLEAERDLSLHVQAAVVERCGD